MELMSKNLNDYLTVAFKPYIILVSIGTAALLVTLLPKLFPYLTEKDVAKAIISGFVTLVGVYAGWRLGVKREKQALDESLKFKMGLINLEVRHISDEIVLNIAGMSEHLNQIQNGAIKSFINFSPVMTMIFDEHFRHAALSFSDEDCKRVKNFYKNAFLYNQLVNKWNELNEKIMATSPSAFKNESEITLTTLMLRSAELISLSGINYNNKDEQLKLLVKNFYAAKIKK